MKKKEFKDCNLFEKIWQSRWYLTLPFIWFYWQYIKSIITKKPKFPEHDSNLEEHKGAEGLLLWQLLKDEIDIKINNLLPIEEILECL